MALQCFDVPSVASACVCFCELLGICSLKLRVDIKAMNAVLQHWNQQNTHSATAQHLHTLGTTHTHAVEIKLFHSASQKKERKNLLCCVLLSKGVKLTEAEPEAAEELIGYLEAAVTHTLEQKGISR